MIIKDPVPISSFLSIEKDMRLIANKIMSNKRLQRLLYYTTPDCLSLPDLNAEQVSELFGNYIKIVPKVYVDGSVLNYIMINFDDFSRNATNPEFRNNMIYFNIICHYDQWQLKDFQLRPYRIAAELDSVLNNQHLTGIGRLEFMGASMLPINDEYAGVILSYLAIHGDEDKKNMMNPEEQAQFEQEFREMVGL